MTLIADVFAKLWTPKNAGRLMFKKSHFRRPFNKQHGKSERENLWHIYWLMWRQLISKECLLVTCKVLRLFVNTLTADDKYYLLNRDNLTQPIQMQLSQEQKTFSHWNLDWILNISKKKMILTADVFPKLRIPKNVVR